MKAEKMIVEIERTRNERQGNRMSAYGDKLWDMREDVASETGDGRNDLQG